MSSSVNKLMPNVNAQYLYTLEMCWSDKGQSDCTPGSLVENVRIRNSRYLFNFVGDTIQYRSYYGWAFVLNTPENLAQHAVCQKLESKIHALEQELHSARLKVITLETKDPDEDTDAAPELVCA